MATHIINGRPQVSPVGLGGGGVASVNGDTGVVVLDKTDVGLGNVDNTSDASKPVSTAQAAADAVNAAAIGDSGGWIAGESWTYVSATSFSVAADVTTKYEVGDKIKLTQTTVKYFYIVAVSAFGAGITTLTVTGGTDYTLANAAITLPFFSKRTSPQGFPQWFNWTPTYVGFTATVPTNVSHRFCLVGRQVTLVMAQTTDGTSNSTSFTLTAPLTSANPSANHSWFASARATDNATTFSTACFITLPVNSNVMSVFKADSATGWTNTGGKKLRNAMLVYEI